MTRRTVIIVLCACLALGAVIFAQAATVRLPGDDQGYAPEQPIAYSHRLHAGELEVPCLYCHSAAEKGRHAGVPSANVCMNCHRFVTATQSQVKEEETAARRAGRDPRPVFSPEIRKLYDALGLGADGRRDPTKQQKAIRWTRVHHNPDFVSFDHRRHVAAGVQCQSCHGDVQTMERVSQFSNLSMGWCVSCHRESNATAKAARDPHRASTDCVVCHQ